MYLRAVVAALFLCTCICESGLLPKRKEHNRVQEGIWTSAQGNAAHTGFMDTQLNPRKFRTIWTKTFTEGATRILQPVITTDSSLYFLLDTFLGQGQYSHLYAVDPASSNTLWSAKLPRTAVMTYADNQIFVQNGASLYSYQAESGKLRNIFPLDSSSLGQCIGPVAFDGIIYTTSKDTLNSRHANTGWLQWLGKPLESSPYCLPAIGDGHIVELVFGGIEVYDTRWGDLAFSIKSPDLLVPSLYNQPPVLDVQNEVVYACFVIEDFENSALVAFDLKNQNIKWTIPSYNSAPALGGNELFLLRGKDDNQLYALDPSSGKVLWSWQPDASDGKLESRYSPIVTPELVFVPGKTKTFAIDRTTHKKVFECAVGGSLAVSGNLLLICNDDTNQASVTAVLLR